MSRLLYPSGESFATGECPCSPREALGGDRVPRLFLPIRIADIATEAVLDTGGAYLILDPEIADLAGFSAEAGLGAESIRIRGVRYTGVLHRGDVVLAASGGEELTVQVTVFVPALSPEEPWALPAYMGWHGCLERPRLAIDPQRELLYFGEA